MRQFTLAFHGEGGSERSYDYWFTQDVVRLTAERLLGADYEVNLTECPRGHQYLSQEELILKLARDYVACDCLVFHLDADSSYDETRANKYEPGARRAKSDSEANHHLLPVIPIRTTEAWILVDFDAFCAVTGLRGKPSDYQFPARARDVERIPGDDAKQRVAKAFRSAGIAQDSEQDVLRRLVEQVSTERLRRVPAYRRFEADFLRLFPFIE